MAKPVRLYCGNVNYEATAEDFREFFSPHEIADVKIVTDRDTGKPRGFAFVDLVNGEEAQKVIVEYDGKDMLGRAVRINEARPKNDSQGGGGGGGRREGGRQRRSGERY